MDRAKVEAFLERFTNLAAGATTIGLLAIADRCGLSSYLGEHGGGTSVEIASGAGLEERYVREILSGLAAAEVVEYDAATRRFDLPPEHALFLSSELSPYFMGGWFDMVPTAMSHIDGLATATREGGGVTFDEYGEGAIQSIDRMNGVSQRVFLTTRWLPAIPGLDERLEAGIRIVDIGCGAGTAALLMAQAYPNCEVVGFDNSVDSIALAGSRVGDVSNVSFEHCAVEDIPLEPTFDLATSFDVIHDLVNPRAGLRRIHEALAADGEFLMMEPNLSSNLEDNLHPIGALFYGVSTMHCMTQSLAHGGEGVGAAWGRQKAEEYGHAAGFSSFEMLDRISNRFQAFYLLKP